MMNQILTPNDEVNSSRIEMVGGPPMSEVVKKLAKLTLFLAPNPGPAWLTGHYKVAFKNVKLSAHVSSSNKQ